jgi:carbon-monoxide dehydrogenase iron sulfur subunit
MKQVIVQPERCVGCRQCMAACAAVHSRSGTLLGAAVESPRPRPRVHVGVGRFEEGFPNRCRHCDPAPCLIACLPGAIFRLPDLGTVLIDPERCINCASCAMACPFGVIRYHEEPLAPAGKTVAVKCDNCIARLRRGEIPACTEACKSGALIYDTPDRALRRRTDAVSRTVGAGAEELERAPGWALLVAARRAQLATRGA